MTYNIGKLMGRGPALKRFNEDFNNNGRNLMVYSPINGTIKNYLKCD